MRRDGTALPTFLIGLLLVCCGPVQRPDGGTGPLRVGDEVPALRAIDHAGRAIAPQGLGSPALIYFYPKDGTPGCTREACALRDAWQRYQDAGVRVIGVSADTLERHREFAAEHDLPFSLVADPQHVWSDAFGVGTIAGLTRRKSFLIDAQGRVVKVYLDVDPGVHALQVLQDARTLGLTREPAGSLQSPDS